jgi:alpha-L-fucosidase
MHVSDGDRGTYWCTDDTELTPQLTLEFGQEITFNTVSIREFLPLGQRVDEWALDRWDGDGWKEFASGTAIGNRRLRRGSDITTERVRLRITKAAACPAISELALFRRAAP